MYTLLSQVQGQPGDLRLPEGHAKVVEDELWHLALSSDSDLGDEERTEYFNITMSTCFAESWMGTDVSQHIFRHLNY